MGLCVQQGFGARCGSATQFAARGGLRLRRLLRAAGFGMAVDGDIGDIGQIFGRRGRGVLKWKQSGVSSMNLVYIR